MARWWVMACAAACSVAAGVGLGRDEPKGLDRLAGYWQVAEVRPDGAVASFESKGADKAGRRQLVFTGDRATFARVGGERHEAKVRLDPDGRRLDLTPATGPDQGKTFYAVFALEGDTLRPSPGARTGRSGRTGPTASRDPALPCSPSSAASRSHSFRHRPVRAMPALPRSYRAIVRCRGFSAVFCMRQPPLAGACKPCGSGVKYCDPEGFGATGAWVRSIYGTEGCWFESSQAY